MMEAFTGFKPMPVAADASGNNSYKPSAAMSNFMAGLNNSEPHSTIRYRPSPAMSNYMAGLNKPTETECKQPAVSGFMAGFKPAETDSHVPVPKSAPEMVSIGTQTMETSNKKQFNVAKPLLRKKAEGVYLLTCFKERLFQCRSLDEFTVPTEDKISEIESVIMTTTNMGVHAFTTNELLTEPIGIYMNLMKILIEEAIKTPDELYMFLQTSDIDKAFRFAVSIAANSSEPESAFEPLNPYDYWCECLALAVAIFARHDGLPLYAIDAALRINLSIKDARDLVISIVCDLVGASYGSNWIPCEWLKYPEICSVMYLARKLTE